MIQGLIDTILRGHSIESVLDEALVYHGVDEEDTAQAIIRAGYIKACEVQGKYFLAPIKGRSYFAQDLSYALVYALGGDVAGDGNSRLRWRGYGYIFGVDESDLRNIQPDEDSIGEMIWKKSPRWLFDMAKIHLTQNTLRNVLNGEYIWWAQAGKKLVKLMTDFQKQELIKLGAHIACEGNVPIRAIWKINKEDIPFLKRDGSNLFQYAKKIK